VQLCQRLHSQRRNLGLNFIQIHPQDYRPLLRVVGLLAAFEFLRPFVSR
jgi:hypothetical protein